MHVQMVLHLMGRVPALSRAALVERYMLLFEFLHVVFDRKAHLCPHIWFSLQHMS